MPSAIPPEAKNSPAIKKLTNDKELRIKVQETCGVTRQAVDKWLRDGIPANRAVTVAKILGISPYSVRPDVFPRNMARA